VRPLHPRMHAASTPHHPAYVMAMTGEVVTYEQLERRANQGAHLFRSWGCQAGDTIAMYAENHPRYFELCWVAQRAGLYFVPLSWHLTTAEVAYVVDDAAASALIVSSAFPEIARALAPAVRVLSIGGEIDGVASYEALRDAEPEEAIADETRGADMMYTSGTTGQPKGVRQPLSGGPIDEVPEHFASYEAGGYGPAAVHLAPGPLYHAAPLRTGMLTHSFGGTVIVTERFDPEEILGVIERYRVTHTNWVPTHFIRLLRLPDDVRARYDVSSLQLVLHGAAPCPIEVKERIIDWFGPTVVEYYAGTEEYGACLITSEEWLDHKGSVGRPLANAVHIIDDETGLELPAGEIGTIYFEDPPDVEYHNAPDKTRAARSAQGWATFGDIGRVDEEGYLYLTDRKADMIITGGVNVYPQEAEQRLILHPKVADVAVFGISNGDLGEEVKAVVQPLEWDDAGPALERDLMAFCREVLSPIKCPRSIDFDTELPRLENGKLYKRVLKERYAATAPAIVS
jgi:long-chain acyl-CoA synthetase